MVAAFFCPLRCWSTLWHSPIPTTAEYRGQGFVQRQSYASGSSHWPKPASLPIERARSNTVPADALTADCRAEAGRRLRSNLYASASVFNIILRSLWNGPSNIIFSEMAAAPSGIGNAQAAGQVGPKKRSRAKAPKVRTGCLTCKIRRVKCDGGCPVQP